MRWKEKTQPINSLGDERVIEKFLILPRCLEGEWRWFEKARIVQVFVSRIVHIVKTNIKERVNRWEYDRWGSVGHLPRHSSTFPKRSCTSTGL